MINLSVDEIAFLEKIDQERKQHAEAKKKYRNKKHKKNQNIRKN